MLYFHDADDVQIICKIPSITLYRASKSYIDIIEPFKRFFSQCLMFKKVEFTWFDAKLQQCMVARIDYGKIKDFWSSLMTGVRGAMKQYDQPTRPSVTFWFEHVWTEPWPDSDMGVCTSLSLRHEKKSCEIYCRDIKHPAISASLDVFLNLCIYHAVDDFPSYLNHQIKYHLKKMLPKSPQAKCPELTVSAVKCELWQHKARREEMIAHSREYEHQLKKKIRAFQLL